MTGANKSGFDSGGFPGPGQEGSASNNKTRFLGQVCFIHIQHTISYFRKKTTRSHHRRQIPFNQGRKVHLTVGGDNEDSIL